MDIETSVKKILEDAEKRNELLRYQELDNSPKKLIDTPHEIIFSLEANILEQNDQHQNVSSKQIHKQNFHMPVPPNKDPEQYMAAFLKHFQDCLIDSYKKESSS